MGEGGRGVRDLEYAKLGTMKDVATFKAHLAASRIVLPVAKTMLSGESSPLAQRCRIDDLTIGNRWAINPMEGWDGTPDGLPTENTYRRWRRFGESGAALIWGGEAVAVSEEGRANPNQLMLSCKSQDSLAKLRETLIQAHDATGGNSNALVIGLQLTHSGRYARPNSSKPEPRILFRHPILDARLNLPPDYPLLTDSDIRQIIQDFATAAKRAKAAGFDFVDIKHCHGYLGHEFLGAHTRAGDYGGSFENRTRFLRETVEAIRAETTGLKIGVRVSAFDLIPYRPDPSLSTKGSPGRGIPADTTGLLPYRYGFGVNELDPTQYDLSETYRLFALFESLGIKLVNVTAGSPYYNPHIQRPALYPPSDGYLPPEDPLVGVARQMSVTLDLKQRFGSHIYYYSDVSNLLDVKSIVSRKKRNQAKMYELFGLTPLVIYETKAQVYQMPFVDLNVYRPAIDAINSLPAHLARKYTALPIKKEGNTLYVAMEDFEDSEALIDIQLASRCFVRGVIAIPDQIKAAINSHYGEASMILVGSAYTYLQDFLPNVAQEAVDTGWVDVVGIGRMVLSYPDICRDTLTGAALQNKRICRTFSDCTTAPRNGLVSGCYPLDPYYKKSPAAIKLNAIKRGAKQNDGT